MLKNTMAHPCQKLKVDREDQLFYLDIVLTFSSFFLLQSFEFHGKIKIH